MADRLRLECPCCEAELTVDPDSGEILHAQPKKRDARATFDSAVAELQSGAQRREDAFAKAFRRTRDQNDLLNKKFEEARRRAKDQGDADDRPVNPMDLD